MTIIKLIGVRTPFYDKVKSHLTILEEVKNISLNIVELNDLNIILGMGYKSVPLVEIDGKQIYFNDQDLDVALHQVMSMLTKEKVKKSHSCKNCGNCKCPADRFKEKSLTLESQAK